MDWVEANGAPAQQNPWLVLVTPDYYQETPFTIPTHVHVQGMIGAPSTDVHFQQEVVIYGDCDGVSAFVTLLGGISDATIYSFGTASSDHDIVRASDIAATMDNVSIVQGCATGAHEVVGIKSTTSSTTVQNTTIQHRTGINQSGSISIKTTGSGSMSFRFGWLMDTASSPKAAIEHNSTGHFILFFTRIGMYTGSTYGTDIINGDNGEGVFVLSSPYDESIGPITHTWRWRNVLGQLTATDSPPGCTDALRGALYMDDSLGEHCACRGPLGSTSWQQLDGGGSCAP